MYLHIAQQRIRSDIIQLTIEDSVTHHPSKSLGGGTKLRGVECDLTVAHVGWELLETRKEILILGKDGAETLLL